MLISRWQAPVTRSSISSSSRDVGSGIVIRVRLCDPSARHAEKVCRLEVRHWLIARYAPPELLPQLRVLTQQPLVLSKQFTVFHCPLLQGAGAANQRTAARRPPLLFRLSSPLKAGLFHPLQ